MYQINNVKIAGISSTVPELVIDNYSLKELYGDGLDKVISNIGVVRRHVTQANQSTADLCLESAFRLLKELEWSPDSIDALIFVTQTPSVKLPSTACLLQNLLGLRTNVIAFDINLGCSGYVYGLHTAGALINSGLKRVLLLVGDTISKIIRPGDRSTELLFGDAGSSTALEYSDGARWDFVLGTDGKGFESIIASNIDAQKIAEFQELNSAAWLSMNGGEVFNFTLRRVPEIVSSTHEISGFTYDDIDYFIYHQANLYMLKHLAKKSNIDNHKMLTSIEDYGNTSSASIPITICHKLVNQPSSPKLSMLVGFGVGLSWGGVVCDLSQTKILPISILAAG